MIPPVFDNTYTDLPPSLFAQVKPDKLSRPTLILLNHALAGEMGLDEKWLTSPDGLAMLSGQKMPEGADPIAMVYGGHQFGHWSGRLGDGRACLLGEVTGSDKCRRDLVLKGCGPTPYSRRGDGKSALGPVLREYIVSEAMAAYGVPTTRALAAIATGENVHREQSLPGGILARVAKSHVRVGTFQYVYAQGNMDVLKGLADYVIARHYPQVSEDKNPYQQLLASIIEGQASLVAKWMGLGFIHGVMNTDNMQIAGETLDYGPCAFMDSFHPQTVFSSIDYQGRYAWGNQPQMALWNLTQLAQALTPLLDTDEDKAAKLAQDALGRFGTLFQTSFNHVFAAKLGLRDAGNAGDFLQVTFKMMSEQNVDFTLFFRSLTDLSLGDASDKFYGLFTDTEIAKDWLSQWRERSDQPDACATSMEKVNPVYIPRNHQIEKAIQAGRIGDFSLFTQFVEVLKRPFTRQAGNENLERPPTEAEIVTQTFCGT